MAPDAGGRRPVDDRDEPSSRLGSRSGDVRRGRQCGRRRARRGRGVDRRGADRQRPGRRCVRARVARRKAPRPQRLRPLAARAGRDPRRRARPALRDGSGSRARLERPRRAVRPLRARSGTHTGSRRRPTGRRLHPQDRGQVGESRDAAVSGPRDRRPLPAARCRRDARAPRRRGTGCVLPRSAWPRR